MKNIAKLLVIFSMLIFMNGCYIFSNTFSNLQSARIPPQDKIQITPSYSYVNYTYESQTEKLADHFGIQIAKAASENSEFRLRYERIALDYNDDEGDLHLSMSGDYNFTSAAPKFSLAKNVLAFTCPIAIFWGEDVEVSETVQLHPALILTLPMSKNIEFNVCPKYIYFLEEGSEDFWTLNLGLGLSSDIERWAIRPEVSYLWFQNQGRHTAFSLGISFTN